MKIGVSLYSFHGYRAEDSLGVKGCIAKAKEIGFEGVDFVYDQTGSYEERLAYAADLGKYCKEIGMQALCLCVGSDFLNCADINAEIAAVKENVDIAAALGCLLMRHDATPGYPQNIKTGRSFDYVLPILADAYKQVTEYAAAKGVRTCIENHGFFAQDPDRVEKLVNAVNHPNFGLLVDMGNFSCADCDNAYAVGVAAPYAFHAHAKDFHIKSGNGDNPGEGFFMSRGGNYLRGAIVGHGDVPVRQCVNALKRAGYDEWLVIEFEGMEDPIRGITVGYNNLTKLV